MEDIAVENLEEEDDDYNDSQNAETPEAIVSNTKFIKIVSNCKIYNSVGVHFRSAGYFIQNESQKS